MEDKDFNPRTHEGCDCNWYFKRLANEISIHAPTRGATAKCVPNFMGKDISIHAPTRGATSRLQNTSLTMRDFNPRTHEGCDVSLWLLCGEEISYFNPRTHEGCDQYFLSRSAYFRIFQSTHPRGVRRMVRRQQCPQFGISIHAPTRGATCPCKVHPSAHVYFNPRTHEGCDNAAITNLYGSCEFQSTHPRGVRPPGKTGRRKEICIFQSTHPRGVRLKDANEDAADAEFQSTHPRGVRRHAVFINGNVPKFQSTHPRGVRHHYSLKDARALVYFNPRTHEGCDSSGPSRQSPPAYFNPRTHEGCDLRAFSWSSYSYPFQSTHPRGVRRQWLDAELQLRSISIHAPTRGATNVCRIRRRRFCNFNPRTHEGCDLFVRNSIW